MIPLIVSSVTSLDFGAGVGAGGSVGKGQCLKGGGVTLSCLFFRLRIFMSKLQDGFYEGLLWSGNLPVHGLEDAEQLGVNHLLFS